MTHDNQNELADNKSDYSGSDEHISASRSDSRAEKPAPTLRDISLESILAEYKGSAYIAGDKRTPSSVLKEKTEKIVLEAAGGQFSNTLVTSEKETRNVTNKEQTIALPSLDELKKVKSHERRAEKEAFAKEAEQSLKIDEKDVISFNKIRHARNNDQNDVAAEVSRDVERQTTLEEDTKKSVKKFFGLFNRDALRDEEEVLTDEAETYHEELEPLIEEEIFEEPDFRVAAKMFAARCNIYSMKSFVSIVLTVIMAILTIVFESNAQLPFGIGENKVVYTGILLIFLFIVMMLSIDKLLAGVVEFFKGRQGIESLNFFSCVITAAAAVYCMITKDTAVGMPYCVISAFSLSFTLWGEKIYYRALTETIKTAQGASLPYGVIAELCEDLDSTVIKKVAGRTAGFYNNLVQADISETAFGLATPVLIISSAVLAFYASVANGQAQYFLHHFAAIMAAAAPFSAVFAFSLPFNAVSRRARQSGAAVAGWGGADDLFHTDGASITDEDIFPQGTISLSGIKLFEEVSPEKALRYTGSLIIASNSGLSKMFSEQLSKQALNLIKVEDFACYEGGIGGLIRGERVITGSAAFMNLMGIRVPTSLNMKNAIFTAVNKKLIAVYSVNYVPVKSVQNALVSVLRYHVKLFFAIRDFNITPVMLEQKFKVAVDDVEYIPIQNSYDISDENKQEAKRVSAILTREGMGPYVEAITGGRRLRVTSLIATIFSLVSAVGGMMIMFAICWAGSFAAASPVNLLIYMLSMLSIVVIICGFARYRQ